MFAILPLQVTLLGAYAIYVDAIARDIDSPLGWALCTLLVGYLLGPIVLGAFLAVYLLSHALEGWWKTRKASP